MYNDGEIIFVTPRIFNELVWWLEIIRNHSNEPRNYAHCDFWGLPIVNDYSQG